VSSICVGIVEFGHARLGVFSNGENIKSSLSLFCQRAQRRKDGGTKLRNLSMVIVLFARRSAADCGEMISEYN
jgi:hypothetical protein